MPEIRKLYMYPWPVSAENMLLLKEAKAVLEIDFLVQPAPAESTLTGRVLALEARPPFVCDHAYLPDVKRSNALQAALWWALSHDEDERVTPIDKQMSRWIGGEVKEIPLDQLARENISTNLKINDASRVPTFQ